VRACPFSGHVFKLKEKKKFKIPENHLSTTQGEALTPMCVTFLVNAEDRPDETVVPLPGEQSPCPAAWGAPRLEGGRWQGQPEPGCSSALLSAGGNGLVSRNTAGMVLPWAAGWGLRGTAAGAALGSPAARAILPWVCAAEIVKKEQTIVKSQTESLCSCSEVTGHALNGPRAPVSIRTVQQHR